MGLLLLISILLFVLSLVGAGGTFAYHGLLKSQISSKDQDLKNAEGEFEPAAIESLIRLDKRLTHTSDLLQKHLSPSAVFDFLSTITLEKVQFTSFSFDSGTAGGATIKLSGVGDSFSTVALQSDQFGSTRLLKDVIFSDVAIGQSGRVTFSVSAVLDPSLYIYSRVGTNSAAIPNQAPASTTAATTTSR